MEFELVMLAVTIFLYFVWLKSFRMVSKENEELKKQIIPHPIAFHTVDMAFTKREDGKIFLLLGQKHREMDTDQWRFPGGFVDIDKDFSAEDAATREGWEETTLTVKTTPENYIGSFKIDDSRYRDSKHGIITSLFGIELSTSEAAKYAPGDDIGKLHWFELEPALFAKINPIHANCLHAVLQKYKITN